MVHSVTLRPHEAGIRSRGRHSLMIAPELKLALAGMLAGYIPARHAAIPDSFQRVPVRIYNCFYAERFIDSRILRRCGCGSSSRIAPGEFELSRKLRQGFRRGYRAR